MRRAYLVLALAAVLPSVAVAQPSQDPHSRHLNDLNWMEVEDLVPERIRTALLPVGTLEAHGVGPNGADNLVPEALAAHLAEELDALVAPTIAYGVNTSLDRYAGTFGVTADVLRELAAQVYRGLARSGFERIVVLNGHGPNFAPLDDAALEIFREAGTHILVIDWWSATPQVTREVFGEDGGHAGVNENAAMMAVAPDAVHPELYRPEQATAFSEAWRAYPFPSSIGLYSPGEGHPEFDRARAERYFERVKEEMLAIVGDVLRKWDEGGR